MRKYVCGSFRNKKGLIILIIVDIVGYYCGFGYIYIGLE